LSLRDNINLESGEDVSVENTLKIGNDSLLNKKWRVPAPEPGKPAQVQLRGSNAPGEEKRKAHSEAKSHHTSRGIFFLSSSLSLVPVVALGFRVLAACY
jgi:hypothetical protein